MCAIQTYFFICLSLHDKNLQRMVQNFQRMAKTAGGRIAPPLKIIAPHVEIYYPERKQKKNNLYTQHKSE